MKAYENLKAKGVEFPEALKDEVSDRIQLGLVGLHIVWNGNYIVRVDCYRTLSLALASWNPDAPTPTPPPKQATPLDYDDTKVPSKNPPKVRGARGSR